MGKAVKCCARATHASHGTAHLMRAVRITPNPDSSAPTLEHNDLASGGTPDVGRRAPGRNRPQMRFGSYISGSDLRPVEEGAKASLLDRLRVVDVDHRYSASTDARSPMQSNSRRCAISILFVLAACVPPATRLGNVSDDAVRAEQLKQQQLVLKTDFEYQQRLDDVAYPLLKAAVPLCTKGLGTMSGIRFANLHSFKREFHAAARGLGFTDTLSIVAVTKGSAADRAGVKAGDRILSIGSAGAPVGPNAALEFVKRLSPRTTARKGDAQLRSEPVRLTMRRGTETSSDTGAASDITLEIPADTVCLYNALAVKDDVLNAWADGKNVVITSAMLRFTATDDDLAVVVAHEIAHNAMGHIDAKKKNATFGAILGAIVDIAAATQGVNTGGDFTSLGAEFGAMSFSQDFEREADYVGMYLLARADRPIAKAPDFWRRMAQESPGSIKFASSHPTTAERFVRLESAVAEIERKRAAAEPLMPEMKETVAQKGKRQ